MEVKVLAGQSFDFKAIAKMDIKDVAKMFKKKDKEESNKPPKKQATKLMNKPVVVFDFGTETIKIAVGRHVKQELKVTQLLTVNLVGPMIVDGEPMELESLQQLLQKALNTNKIKIKDAIACVNSTQIITREILIPLVAVDEIETVVRYEMGQFLPINLESYQVQYIILDEIMIGNEKKYKLNVIAFPDKMAVTYYNLLKELGLKPYALDTSFNAIGKLAQLEESKLSQEGTVAFVDMGAQSIDVNIYHEQMIQFTRMIKSGGQMIDQHLSQANMSIKSAASYKSNEADLQAEISDDVANNIVRYSVDDMLTELERVFQFYRNKAMGNSIDKLYVFGGTSHLKGIIPYMENRFNIPTATIQEFTKIELASTVDQTLALSDYANALGAMIRY